ncbi:hypothetical protein SteCoe_8511 [Stentor coeruleus]|uniref:Uncharacterized protein n=1 Tax=Stentor coeruleus TaxID=5963 RepID=A0A1R2CK76_9CILI|nr:hypothetical protein SteCoe_8511 [Stentor coeruleus]
MPNKPKRSFCWRDLFSFYMAITCKIVPVVRVCWRDLFSFYMAITCKIVPVVQVAKTLVSVGLATFYSLSEGLSFLAIHHIISKIYLVSVLFALCTFFAVKILFLFRRKMVDWKSFEFFYKSLVFCSFFWIAELAVLTTVYVYYEKNPFDLMTLTILSFYCIMQDLYFSFCIYSTKANSEIGNMFSIFEGKHPSEINDNNLPQTERISAEVLLKKKVKKNTYTIVVQDFTQGANGQFVSSEVLKV